MKNIVLCFDHTDEHPGPRAATNTQALFELLDGTDQLTWYHSGCYRSGVAAVFGGKLSSRRRADVVDEARTAVADAYEFLRERWAPGDDIFVFGSGEGAHQASELAALLGLVGLLPSRSDDLLAYALATYVLGRTERTRQDWQRVSSLTAELLDEAAVPVKFLGLWDAKTIRGAGSGSSPLANVGAGRHAVAVDGGRRRLRRGEWLDEVWFRGENCDIAGGNRACWPLADIALDWMLHGAVRAGLRVRERNSSPTDLDALAGGASTLGLRRLPPDARVHASVSIYLRAHPQYWRRFPSRIEWADMDWLARGERLVPAAAETEPQILTAAAS